LYNKSGLELKKFFNTSGKKYRELGVKDKIKTASEDELLELLSSDGMLLKRPLVTDGKKVTVGFKESTFEENWMT
jgi:arsenate reductase